MTIWTFYQSGSIPGVPGTFAGVSVDVDEATNVVRSITPLAAHTEFVANVDGVQPDKDAVTPDKDAKDAPTEPIAVPIAPDEKP